MYRLLRRALPWAFLLAFVLGAAIFATEYLFAISAFLVLAGTAADILYGKEMERRGLFQFVLIVLYAVVIVTMPRCGTSNPSADQTGLSDTY